MSALKKVIIAANKPLGVAGAIEGLECGHWHVNSEGWSSAGRRRCRKCQRSIPRDFEPKEVPA